MFNKKTKLGAYTLVMGAVVLAVIVFINILVLNAPEKYTKLDITSLELYTLSEETEKAVSKINEDVNIYLLCSGGEDGSGNSLNNMPSLSIFLGRYTSLSDRISFKIVDPISDPTFADAYDKEGLAEYTVIVESAKRFKIISFEELYYYYSDEYGVISADEYSSFMTYMYYYTGSYPATTLNFDGELLITSALDYVTTDRIPAVYYLEGHGESAISTTLSDNIKNDNMTLSSLNMLTSDIPDDAECIIINVPTSDINADEAAALSAYLAGGGNVYLVTDYRYLSLPNLFSVLGEYGLSGLDGVIIEGDSSMHYNNYPYYLLPDANANSALLASLASSAYIFAPLAHPISFEETENITKTSLFSTSTSAYTIAADARTYEKTEDSAEGAFDVAVMAENSESGGRIIWFSSALFNDNANQMTGGNYRYFISILGNIVERQRITYNIPSDNIAASYLVVSESQANIWGSIFVIILPLAFAVGGTVCWIRRRRR